MAEQPLHMRPEFVMLLGTFHGAWGTLELVADFAIGRLLNLEPMVTHLMTSRVDFNRKARILRYLTKRHKNRTAMMGALNKIQNESKRNVLAHAYIISDERTVSFIERTAQGEIEGKPHTFDLAGFAEHVRIF